MPTSWLLNKLKLSVLLLVFVYTAVGCSSRNDNLEMDGVPTIEEETLSVDDEDISTFIGTWKGCEVDGTAGDIRHTFIFDGDVAIFLSEAISFFECSPQYLTSESFGSWFDSGELVFKAPITDSALGFTSYPITLINSKTDKPDITNLIYTDGSVLYLGDNSSRPSEEEAPTALNTYVVYEYAGPPDLDLVDSDVIR